MTQDAAWGVTSATGNDEQDVAAAAVQWTEAIEATEDSAPDAESVSAQDAQWDEDADPAEADAEAQVQAEAEAEAELEAEADVEVAPVEGTGHPAVDAAVRAVANAEDLPVAEQLAAYEGAHQTLREVLASIED